MSDYVWLERQLLHDRLLIRGTVDTKDVLTANLTLIAKFKDQLAVIWLEHRAHGGTLYFPKRTPPQGTPWMEAWRQVVEGWANTEWLFFNRRQEVVVLDSFSPEMRPLPPADPRLLLHYGTALQTLQEHAKRNGVLVGESEPCNAMAEKLRGLIVEQVRAWKPILGG